MKLKILLLTGLFIISSGFAQDNSFNTQEITTLDEFINEIIENHLIFERLEMNISSLEAEQIGLTGSQDWKYKTNSSIMHVPQISMQNTSLNSTTGITAGGSIEQLNWENGSILSAEISLGASYLAIEDDPMYSMLPNSSFDNSLYVTYVLPLKKNWKGLLYKVPYDMKEIEIEQTKLSNIESYENFIAPYALDFIDWSYYQIERAIVAQRLEIAQQSYKRNQDKQLSNLIDKVDVVSAENAIKNVELAISANSMSENALVKRLDEIIINHNLSEKTPIYDIYNIQDLPEIEDIITEFKENSRTLSSFKKSLDLMDMNMIILTEQLKPDVSITGRAGLKDSDQNYFDAILMDKPEIMLTLNYGFAGDKTKEKADILMLEISIEQLKKQYTETELEFVSTIRNIHSQLEDMTELLEINKQQIELTQNQTKEYNILFERGKKDFAFILQSQDAQANAKLNYAKNARNYQKLYIQLLSLTDKLYTE